MATIVTAPYNCTFIHIPKTGGNSITSWLKENTTAKVTKRNQHATIQEVLDGKHSLGPMNIKDLGWKFCVVRNPWDYIVSWYTFEIMLCKLYIEKIKTDPTWTHPTKKKYNLKLQESKLKKLESQGFNGFVNETQKKLQYSWAKDCDYIIRLENMNEDFKEVQSRLNCFVQLPVKNKTTNRTVYQDYYNSKLKDIVYQKYKTDINKYGYEFE
jgi:hypothetical protein